MESRLATSLITWVHSWPFFEEVCSLLTILLSAIRLTFETIVETDFDSNIFLKILSRILYYGLTVVLLFIAGCMFVSMVINPFYDPMEAYDICLFIFNITGHYPTFIILT